MPRIAPATSSIPPLAHSAWSARTLGTRLAVAGTMAAVVTALGILAVRAMVSGSPAKPEVEALAGAPSPGGDAATESGDGAPDELPHAAPLDAMSDPLPETLPARHVAPSASAAPSPSGHQAGPGASPRSGPKPELRKRDPWSAQ